MAASVQKNPGRRGSWLVTLPLAGLTLVYFVFVYLPGTRSRDELLAELQEKQALIARSGELRSQVERAGARLEETHTYVRGWQTRAEGGGLLYGEISKLMKSCGVETTRFEPGPSVEREAIEQRALLVGCRGSFQAVSRFVAGLERLPQLIWVDEMHLEKPEENGTQLSCQLKLVVFDDRSGNSD